MSGYNEDDKKIGPAIGIDLGTWKCCVGVVRDGKVEIIENERGSKTTPSYVAFTKTERIIGEDAKSQASLNPTNTVYGVKRIIGRRFDDPSLLDIKDTFPFTLEQENGGKPFIEVEYKGNKKCLYPEQVTAMLLTKMKRIAESHLQCKVRDAVISVPAHFNNAQRRATKDAGAIAGLNVLGLINEPTAAALAYRDNKGPTDETICLVDLGGGTLDVSIIRMEGNKGITVLKTQGNTSFGGMNLDQRLVAHFRKEFLEVRGHEISGSKAFERLRLACEKLKHTLSLLPTGRIQLDRLASDADLESSIARDTFDVLCHEDFHQSLYSVLTKILECEQPDADRFNRVVLVGGSTRIPYVQELLKNVLDKRLDKSVNPDEAVAHGAAIKAALLGREPSLPDVAVSEVSAHTFVLESEDSCDIIFHQYSSQSVNKFIITSLKNFNAQYNLYESLFDIDTKGKVSRQLIGSVKLSDWADPVKSELLFTIDVSGIFGGEILVGKNRHVLPINDYCLKSKDKLAVMCQQEKEFSVDEENEKRRLVSLSDLEAYCFCNKPLIEELIAEDNGSEELKQKFLKLCDDTIDWLDYTPETTEKDCKKHIERLVEMHGRLIPPLPDVVNLHNVSVAPCTGSSSDPNTGLARVGRKAIGTGSEPIHHPIRDTSSARPEDDLVYLPPVERPGYQDDEQTGGPFAPWVPDDSTYTVNAMPNSDVVNRNHRDADRDGVDAANNARAGPSTTSKRSLDGFGTGRHTRARAEGKRLREVVPVHGVMKVSHKRGYDPFPNDYLQSDKHPADAGRNATVGTSAGADIQIQMNRRDSSNLESQDHLGGAGHSLDKPSSRKQKCNTIQRLFACFQKKKRRCLSEGKDRNLRN